MTAPPRKAKPRFYAGQVVCALPGTRCEYGQIVRRNDEGRFVVKFWDADRSDTWWWDYAPSDLRPLTARERGDRKGRGKS